MEAACPLQEHWPPQRTEAIRQQLGLTVRRCRVLPWRKNPSRCEGVAGPRRNVSVPERGPDGRNRFCLLPGSVDFPIYEKDEEPADRPLNTRRSPSQWRDGRADWGDRFEVCYQYDLAVTAMKLGLVPSGTTSPRSMFKAFEIAGYGKDEVETVRPGHG